MEMSSEELSVLRLIKERTRDNPITDREISRLTGIDHRSVADITKRLVELFHIPIGAAKEEPFGRFIIRSREELERYLASLLSMEKSIIERINALRTAYAEYSEREQLQLQLKV